MYPSSCFERWQVMAKSLDAQQLGSFCRPSHLKDKANFYKCGCQLTLSSTSVSDKEKTPQGQSPCKNGCPLPSTILHLKSKTANARDVPCRFPLRPTKSHSVRRRAHFFAEHKTSVAFSFSSLAGRAHTHTRKCVHAKTLLTFSCVLWGPRDKHSGIVEHANWNQTLQSCKRLLLSLSPFSLPPCVPDRTKCAVVSIVLPAKTKTFSHG